MSKLKQANQKIQTAVIGGYQKIEKGVVSGYQKIEDKFVDTFLSEEGETPEEAKERIAQNVQQRQQENENRRRGN